MTFLIAEDEALRKQLFGMTVQDGKSAEDQTVRQVGVWFGMPDPEIRSQSYPYVVIDMIDVNRDLSREMRGKTSASYLAAQDPSYDPESWEAFEVNLPIPVNIDYQITTYARHPRHDREILGQLMATRLPIRFGTLECNDGTVRRLDVLSMQKRDSVEQNKRLFMNAITLRVSSEVSPEVLTQLYKVRSVYVEPSPKPDMFGFDFVLEGE